MVPFSMIIAMVLFVLLLVVIFLYNETDIFKNKNKTVGTLRIYYDSDEPNPYIYLELNVHPDELSTMKTVKLNVYTDRSFMNDRE